MKKMFEQYLSAIDPAVLRRKTEELTAIEMGQTFRHYRKAIEYISRTMKESGLSDVEIMDFPADGKTAYCDMIMPIAWDASVGKLSLLKPAPGENAVLADFQEHPFHLVKGSVATPPEGVISRIITEQQVLAGEDPAGALVMLESLTSPRRPVIRPILDMGALGFVTDFLTGRYNTPDSVQWVNAGAETLDWHVTAEDRPFIGFSVSPRTGDLIRQKANRGNCKVLVQCDGKRYEGKLPLVTGIVPGRQKKEVWLIAHTFEPLLDDDSSGVIAGIEIARQIMLKGTPEYTLRLVFAMEVYGYAAYVASRGENLKNEVIGGCNIDTLAGFDHCSLELHGAGPAVPFIGNKLMKECYDELNSFLPLTFSTEEYYDDNWISDPTVGVPTLWAFCNGSGYWHNSIQCDPKSIAWEKFHKNTAFVSTLMERILNYTGPAPEREQFEIKEISSPWREYADQMIFARKTTGFPHSLARIPLEQRRVLPTILYGPFSNILCNMDGKKSLARLILEAEAERNTVISESEIRKLAGAVNYLADWGYLEIIQRQEITKDDITTSLKQLGITAKDTLLVHSSVASCGYIANGAETVIDAIAELADTALFASFNYPFIHLGSGVNKNWWFRPFDPADIDAVWTGDIPKTVLRKYPEAIRSRHVTHSWVGLGKHAAECLADHAPCDPPCGITSPLHKALERNGKILFFGTGLGPTTFLHYLEDQANLPGLGTAICRVRESDGKLKTVLIENHLPGDRDFYRHDAENCKFFRRAVTEGLEIKNVALGMGTLQLIDIRQLYTIGMKLVQEDPRILMRDEQPLK